MLWLKWLKNSLARSPQSLVQEQNVFQEKILVQDVLAVDIECANSFAFCANVCFGNEASWFKHVAGKVIEQTMGEDYEQVSVGMCRDMMGYVWT